MTTRFGRCVFAAALAVVWLSSTALADSLTFSFGTLPANGAVAGPPGSTVGWGYTVTNNSLADWLVPTALNAGVFLNLNPAVVPNPNVLFDFPIVAPLQTVTLGYTPKTAGLFEITWASTAPLGFVNSGNFVLSADFYNANPLLNPSAVDLGPAPDVSTPYSATVPEPPTLLLLSAGLWALQFLRKRFPSRTIVPTWVP
jgi:hypothetical protein